MTNKSKRLSGLILVLAFAVLSYLLAQKAFGQQQVSGTLDTIGQICRGGVGRLFDAQGGFVVFQDATARIQGERVFISDEAGNFTQELLISFSEYQGCIERLLSVFFGSLDQYARDLLQAALRSCEQGDFDSAAILFARLETRHFGNPDIARASSNCARETSRSLTREITLLFSPAVVDRRYPGEIMTASFAVDINGRYCGLLSNHRRTDSIECSTPSGNVQYEFSNVLLVRSRNGRQIESGGICSGVVNMNSRNTEYAVAICSERGRLRCGMTPLSEFLQREPPFSIEDCPN